MTAKVTNLRNMSIALRDTLEPQYSQLRYLKDVFISFNGLMLVFHIKLFLRR